MPKKATREVAQENDTNDEGRRTKTEMFATATPGTQKHTVGNNHACETGVTASERVERSVCVFLFVGVSAVTIVTIAVMPRRATVCFIEMNNQSCAHRAPVR